MAAAEAVEASGARFIAAKVGAKRPPGVKHGNYAGGYGGYRSILRCGGNHWVSAPNLDLVGGAEEP